MSAINYPVTLKCFMAKDTAHSYRYPIPLSVTVLCVPSVFNRIVSRVQTSAKACDIKICMLIHDIVKNLTRFLYHHTV